MTKSIAIVGAHSATKLGAPFDNPQWVVWSLSPKNENQLPRVDVWFEMHKRFLDDPDADGKEYGDWLRSRPIVYMLEHTPLIEGSVAYPRDRMVEAFGAWFFNSSLSWLLAKAVDSRPLAIAIYGVERSAGEYAAQRQSIQAFALAARMRGIGVDAPGSSILDGEMLYGYDYSERDRVWLNGRA